MVIKLPKGKKMELPNSLSNKYCFYHYENENRLNYRLGHFKFDNSRWLTNLRSFVRVNNSMIKINDSEYSFNLSKILPKSNFINIENFDFTDLTKFLSDKKIDNRKVLNLGCCNVYNKKTVYFDFIHVESFLKINNDRRHYWVYDLQVVDYGIYLYKKDVLQGFILGIVGK